MNKRRIWGLIALTVGIGFSVYLLTRTTSDFQPPERQGPPALVSRGDVSAFWVVLKREEQRQVRRGVGFFSQVSLDLETLYHFELHAHDVATGRPIWQRTLVTLRAEEGGRDASARILGQDGEIIWLFVRDGPMAVSFRDGSQIADRARLEEINPVLRGLIPSDLGSYTFLNSLVIMAADGRHQLIPAKGFVAREYTPPDGEGFRRASYMTSTWHGGYRTSDFLVQQGTFGGRRIGLYSEAEAADAGNDEFGEKLRDPSRVLYEGTRARRAFWSAQIGQTRAFSEGRHDRLLELHRIPESPEFLAGGLLARAGTRLPFVLTQPPGLLVLHRTRIDEQGRLALARLDADLNIVWQIELPLTELSNRWQLKGGLLLYGTAPPSRSKVSQRHEHLVVIDLPTGATQAWDVNAERSVETELVLQRQF